MNPGWVKTDMGGPGATLSPGQGADTASTSPRSPTTAPGAASSTSVERSAGKAQISTASRMKPERAGCVGAGAACGCRNSDSRASDRGLLVIRLSHVSAGCSDATRSRIRARAYLSKKNPASRGRGYARSRYSRISPPSRSRRRIRWASRCHHRQVRGPGAVETRWNLMLAKKTPRLTGGFSSCPDDPVATDAPRRAASCRCPHARRCGSGGRRFAAPSRPRGGRTAPG
jgi:hypothetical protein